MPKLIKIAGVAAVAALALYGSNLEASATPAACTVTTDGTVVIRAGDQDLKVRASEPMEGQLTAEFAPEARVRVVSVARDADGAITVKLNAESAAPGRHALTLKAGTAECKGDVAVTAGE
ncbi:MAG: hypothetical protein KF689_03820 [Gemmatimonadaceae bacterium]|nr:hypothetical protein [Gemmatimonadaceae bacterium]MCW5825691.1 hypothetical protein [Gemmatimonadaceae bacterium]